MVDRYLAEYAVSETKASSYRETKRIFDVDVLPAWGDRPLTSITDADVVTLLNAVRNKPKRSAARRDRPRHNVVQRNRTLARLSALFNWCTRSEAGKLLSASPAAGIKKLKEPPRTRKLNRSEVRWFWRSCDAMGWPFGRLFQLLLTTVQRDGEVSKMEWADVDLENKTWMTPWAKAKNDEEHATQLSDIAVEILQSLPRVVDADGKSSRFVFTTTGRTPVSGFSKAKAQLDALMEAERRKDMELPDDAPAAIPPFILHDTRRTAVDFMAEMGIGPHVADKILNHTTGTISGVAAIYNTHTYSKERRDALQAWGRYITALVNPVDSNVVQLPAAATA